MLPMSIRDYILLGFIAISATTGALWWSARDARIRAEGAAEVYEQEVDSLNTVFLRESARADSARRVSDSVTAHEGARIAALTPERERAMTRANAGEARIDTITARISERAGADSALARRSAQEAVDSVMTMVVAPLRANSTYADSIIGSQAKQINALDNALKVATDALVVAQAEIATQKKAAATREKARSGLVSRNLEKVAYGIAGALIALVVEHR